MSIDLSFGVASNPYRGPKHLQTHAQGWESKIRASTIRLGSGVVIYGQPTNTSAICSDLHGCVI